MTPSGVCTGTLSFGDVVMVRVPFEQTKVISDYKAFHNQLVPSLHSVYTESLSNGSLPAKLRQALISVRLKKGKDPELCASYMPISLLPPPLFLLLQ